LIILLQIDLAYTYSDFCWLTLKHIIWRVNQQAPDFTQNAGVFSKKWL